MPAYNSPSPDYHVFRHATASLIIAILLTALTFPASSFAASNRHDPGNNEKSKLELRFNQRFTPRVVYNIFLPFLIRSQLFQPNTPLPQKVLKAQEFVHGISTPGKGPHYAGLGTAGQNPGGSISRGESYANAGLLVASGNMLCSEQAMFAANMFSDSQTLARVDVVSHTFMEVAHNGNWILLDPMFNPHLLRPDGTRANAQDLIAWVDGDTTRFEPPDPLPQKIRQYLNLFDRNRYTDNSSTRGFGFRAVTPPPDCDAVFAASHDEFVAHYRPPLPTNSPRYHAEMAYLKCHFSRFANRASKKKLLGLQNTLLGLMKKRWRSPMDWDIYEARQHEIVHQAIEYGQKWSRAEN